MARKKSLFGRIFGDTVLSDKSARTRARRDFKENYKDKVAILPGGTKVRIVDWTRFNPFIGVTELKGKVNDQTLVFSIDDIVSVRSISKKKLKKVM